MQLSTLMTLHRMVAALRQEAPELPLQQLHAFLAIALDEGLSTKDVEKRCGFTNASASRNVQALYDHAGAGRDGLDWVKWQPSRQDGRVRQLYLTPKGQAVLEKISAVVEK